MIKLHPLVLAPCLALAMLAGCASEGAEPDNADIHAAYRTALERLNDNGGITLQMGSAGAGQVLRLGMRLHGVEKKSCVGKERVYTCLVSTRVSYPPVKDEPETHEVSLVLFDGPGGWRIIE